MNEKNIIEFAEGIYIDLDTLQDASSEDVEIFKKNCEIKKQETARRISENDKEYEDFIDKHKYEIMHLLDYDEDMINDMYKDLSLSMVIRQFSTALFDLMATNSEEKFDWLHSVKKNFGKKFYYDVIEGYVLGNHDT